LKTSSELKETNFYQTGMITVQVEYADGRLAHVYVQAGSGLRAWCKLTASEARELRQILIGEGEQWPSAMDALRRGV